MSKHIDHSGIKVNKLTFLHPVEERDHSGGYKYMVECECGTRKVVRPDRVFVGETKSCGCLRKTSGPDNVKYVHGGDSDAVYKVAIMKRYGLAPEEYDAMVEKHNNCCAICESPAPKKSRKKRLNIDHDHKSGKVRGLLCDKCNQALGLFKDDLKLIKKATSYLAR